ncbi:hypothetical protein [Bacilliculturomica massiliensis]|uniref:hypothetical protein n=1 Tax=Bacilliculturomica massiliensis TaxID=1917867 RepID=UPI0010306EB8|nr:hypothetical protein [Bacilliculturomica massiliensis]
MARSNQAACRGIIGIADDGCPIVTADYDCPLWQGQPDAAYAVHECWYCIYADFRKSAQIYLAQSICRHPGNRVEVRRKNDIGSDIG